MLHDGAGVRREVHAGVVHNALPRRGAGDVHDALPRRGVGARLRRLAHAAHERAVHDALPRCGVGARKRRVACAVQELAVHAAVPCRGVNGEWVVLHMNEPFTLHYVVTEVYFVFAVGAGKYHDVITEKAYPLKYERFQVSNNVR